MKSLTVAQILLDLAHNDYDFMLLYLQKDLKILMPHRCNPISNPLENGLGITIYGSFSQILGLQPISILLT